MFILPSDANDLRFPPVELASPEGLLAIGGDLCSERLLEAYRHGIFPWYSGGQPILWWSPDPRAVLVPSRLKISRSLRQTLRRREFHVTLDSDFVGVINACAEPRAQNPEGGTWITAEMIDAYCHLHEQGFAHSVEAWAEGNLVGGLYGVALGGAFFGESMFSRQSDASKVALAYLARQLDAWGFVQIDCQLPSPHLMSMGAIPIRRRDFLRLLDAALALPDRRGRWHFDTDLKAS
jgi:leucyl/phenylalanyl-tRNA---protein transferase